MKFRAHVVIVAAALVTAGCASGSPTPTGSPASKASVTTSLPSPNVAADKALAEAAIFKLNDFPTGWTSKPSTPSSSNEATDRQMSACLHTSVPYLDPSKTGASADSPDFSDSNSNEASNGVTYTASVSQARKQFAVVQSQSFPSCFESAINTLITSEIQHPSNPSDTLPQGASVGKTTVQPMSFPTIGDQSVAYRVTIPITYGGMSVDGQIDIVASQKGRAIALSEFTAFGTPFDSAMEVQLSTLTASRIAST
jgi:hypothetical protein